MAATPKVSVSIRLYNGVEYLEEAIDSVLSQTFTDWDLTIGVNGHGADGNAVHVRVQELLRAKGDQRLRVVNYPEVKGGAAALNALARDARADWIAILDADDKWVPQKLETQWDIIRRVPVDIVGTWCVYFGEMSGGPQIPGGLIDNRIFRRDNPMINSSVLMKKGLAVFSDLFYGLDDYDLWCRLSKEDKVFYNVPMILTYHRIHRQSSFNASKRQDVVGLRKHHFG
jgi:glycosyltransferase involved in cell wall biosynthesis